MSCTSHELLHPKPMLFWKNKEVKAIASYRLTSNINCQSSVSISAVQNILSQEKLAVSMLLQQLAGLRIWASIAMSKFSCCPVPVECKGCLTRLMIMFHFFLQRRRCGTFDRKGIVKLTAVKVYQAKE